MDRIKLLIITEGEKTEPNYLQEIIGNKTAIKVINGGSRSAPHKLVQQAINESKQQKCNEIWVLMDYEFKQNNPGLKKAFSLAEKFRINLAISNPSFEYWLLLHEVQNFKAWRSQKELQAFLQKKIGEKYCKSKLPPGILQKIDTAMIHAKEGRDKRGLSSTNIKDFQINPYTNIDILIERIENI